MLFMILFSRGFSVFEISFPQTYRKKLWTFLKTRIGPNYLFPFFI